ncbi:NAD+ synthase [Methylomarinum sp. Ch1-1]|uniref:Glutamine-dependent NAD(+) synthetase n=1 Tax=Methylomarinum roseum TaxID=3067653 RepID=A0AAU7NVH1_9GAMM
MSLKIALAQVNLTVGDIESNKHKIIASARHARDNLQADLVLFPELSVTAYPPEDLLFRADFIRHARQAVEEIAAAAPDIDIVLGYPEQDGKHLFNSAAVLRGGKVLAVYRKKELPNYGVFDEHRYFTSADELCLFETKGRALGITICEDIWQDDIIASNKQAGAEIILTLNASPFHAGKIHEREDIVRTQAKASAVPLVYVNQYGGQDELIFDGASFVVDQQGEVVFRAAEFEEQISVVEFNGNVPLKSECAPLYAEISSEYKALVLGVKDYVRKNGFDGALLGLSGGIDSALVLAIAVDALGADNVEAVLMPSRYTQDISVDDAVLEAEALGVKHHIIPIEPAVNAFNEMLAGVFAGSERDTTEENIQARSRGVVLMALSNKQDKLLLTTGNKSELSVGYATLYGDMAGGFAPIKDVPKLLVYKLARYRNTLSPVIPERVIDRPPSAELAPDQVDEDSLPPYSVLDPILEMYVEQDKSEREIIAAGFKQEDVHRAISLVDRNEYKRRQAPPGIRITPKAFGRDRRYPISSGYRGVHRFI